MIGFDSEKVRRHRRSEAEAGFPLLRATPSTSAISLVLFLDRLSRSDQLDYVEQLSSLEEEQTSNPPKTNDDFLNMIRARPLLADYMGPSLNLVPPAARPIDIRRMPVKILANVLSDEKAGGFEGFAKIVRLSDEPGARAPAPAHASSFDDIVPIAPRRLKKLIDQTMQSRFTAAPQKLDKELTRYTARLTDGSLVIDVSFARAGALSHQFNYAIGGEKSGRKLWRLIYESIWRSAHQWDYVTEENAERSVSHLARLIDTCLELV